MNMLWETALALLMVAVAGYAQYRIPEYTVGRVKVAIGRATLIGVGLAFGSLMAAPHAAEPARAAVFFVIGFGAVHTPAAAILFLKRQRKSGKS